MDRTEYKKWDLETGARVQERAQFYSLTLAFTLLGLAVQTANISGDKLAAVLETLAATALLVSGLAGLWRALALPAHYKIQVLLHSLYENIDDAKGAKAKGSPLVYSPLLEKSIHVDEYIEEHDKGVRHFIGKKVKLESKLSRYMKFHKYGLLLGVLILMTSRVFAPAAQVLF